MKEFFSNLKFTWPFIKKQKNNLIMYIISSIFVIIISLIVPIFSAKIIIHLTNSEWLQLVIVAVLIFITEMIRNIVRFISNYNVQKIYRENFSNLQIELGKSLLTIENKCIDNYSSGVFIERLSSDTSKMADIFNLLIFYITEIIINIGIFFTIFLINKVAFLYIVIMVFILFLISKKRATVYNAKDKIMRGYQEKASGFVGELVRGIRDIKMLNAETSFIDELKIKVKKVNDSRYEMGSVDRKYQLLNDFICDLFDLGLILLLVYLILQNELLIASALIIFNYSGRVLSITNYVHSLMTYIKNFNLSCFRVFAIFKEDEFQKETFGSRHLEKVNGDFEFKDVSFSYENKKVLNHLSFQIKANETVAFVGKSGAGKTTIFNLLCKMYDVSSGEILIDGINIKKLDKDSIRGNITIINQNPYIFNMSIRDNLKLVKKDLSEEEMIEACKLACLHDFIMDLKDGYDSIIGEGGVNLSGGQRQRLAIARAFVQKTEIILFDEATSALDNETQAKIQKAIDNMKKDYTILIIAHRLSTIINSDRILFIHDGKVEAEGTHEYLLEHDLNYKELYEAELKK